MHPRKAPRLWKFPRDLVLLMRPLQGWLGSRITVHSPTGCGDFHRKWGCEVAARSDSGPSCPRSDPPLVLLHVALCLVAPSVKRIIMAPAPQSRGEESLITSRCIRTIPGSFATQALFTMYREREQGLLMPTREEGRTCHPSLYRWTLTLRE